MKLRSIILAIILILSILTPIQAKTDVRIYGILEEKTHFKYPMSIFVDTESDNMIVADTGHGRILQCVSDGQYIDTFGFDKNIEPIKILRDPGRRIIICDRKNKTLQFFDRKGTYLSTFVTPEDPVAGISEPVSLAIDKQGKFYILDAKDCRVKVFEGGGTFLFSMGREGSEEGELKNPTDVAIDSSGNVYVVDSGNNRISIYDKNGNFTKVFGENDLLHPWGITLNGGSIYVSDTGNHRIVTFSLQGIKTEETGKRGFGINEFNYPTGIQIDAKGQLWIADSGNNRICKVKKGSDNSLVGWESLTVEPTGIVESNGVLYVTEKAAHHVNVYQVDSGLFVNSIGLAGTSVTGMKSPTDCDFLPRGDLVVSDSGNNRIQIYSTSGEHLVSFCSKGSGAGQLNNPQGLTCTQDGMIIVADTGNKRVAVLSQGGTWDFAITEKLEEPLDCAKDSLGRIWVTDGSQGLVQIYDANGNFIQSLEASAFSRPASIFIDKFGRVFITDSLLGKTRVFSIAGYELSEIGSNGGPNTLETPPFLLEQPAQFFNPVGVYANESNVFICDTGNSRIQKIPLKLFGGLPILNVRQKTIDFPKVPLKSSREQVVSITNLGGGKIEGKVKADQPWIRINNPSFSDEIDIVIEAVGEKAREGTRDGNVIIESNGGIAKIPVTARFFAGEVKKVEMTVGMNKVTVNGKAMNVSPAPFAQKDTNVVFVPFRFIGEGFGANVAYDGTRIHYLLEGKTLILTLSNTQAWLDGKMIQCKNPPYRMGQAVVVPLRFVVENLGGVLKVNGKQLTAEYP
jgi:sugar lactone lactonase YvrE